MKASKGITLGAVVCFALCGLVQSAVAAGDFYSDMKDTRDEISAKNRARRANTWLSRNFNHEKCAAGKIWIAHGRDNIYTNGQLDAAEVVNYTCEDENVSIVKREDLTAWSLSCLGKGGVRLSFGIDVNYDGVLSDGEVNPELVKNFCNESSASRSGVREAKRYWKSLDPSPM